MASISIHAGGGVEKYTLQAESVTLGRGAESDIRLNDIKASRIHIEIVQTPDGYVCSDLDSGNGTKINDQPIKEQLLKNGDKIQIGATVIVFGGPSAAPAQAPKPPTARVGAPPPAKPSTGRVPAAKPPTARVGAPPPAKPSTGRVPAMKPPTARVGAPLPAKPSTGRVPAMKPPTARVGAPPPAKPSTGRVPAAKPAAAASSATKRVAPGKTTSSMKAAASTRNVAKNGAKTGRTGTIKKTGRFKTTGRVGKTTRSMGRGGMTERFHKEASRKKMNPITVLIVGIGVIFVAAVGWIFFGPSEVDVKVLKVKVEATVRKAAEASDNFEFDKSIALYNEAIELYGELESKSGQAEVKNIIKTVEERRTRYKELSEKFNAFKAGYAAEPKELRKYWNEGMDLARSLGKWEVPWRDEFDKLHEGIGEELDRLDEVLRNLAFVKWRSTMGAKHKLDDDAEANWTGLFKDGKDYVANPDVSESDKGRAKEWLESQQSMAFESFDRVKRSARRKAEEGNTPQAVELLKKQRPRFEGAKCIGDLDKYLEELDK